MFGLSPTTLGILFALITACGLGSITTQAKVYYSDGGDALSLMLIRFVASTLVFGLLWLLKRKSFNVPSQQRLPLFGLGLVWSGAMICYLISVETVSVSLAVLIFYTYPLLVLAWSILRRQVHASASLIGLFIGAFIGLYLALSGGAMHLDPIGFLFAGLASVGAAFTFICGAKVAPKTSPLLTVFWINAVGLIMILPLLLDGLAWPEGNQGIIALSAATLFYLVAILSQFEALARLPAARAAMILNLEPAVSILMARLVIDETLTVTQWSGVILIISIIILSLRFKPAAA